MHEGEQHDGESSNNKGNKKPRRWPDYFAWMVKIAAGLVGKNDAEDVANAALYDVICSDRPRPPIEHHEEVERLLRHLIWLRARAFWKAQKRRRPEVLTAFDMDEQHLQFDQGRDAERAYARLMLTRLLAGLSPIDRELLWGFVVEGFTVQQLAAKYKMNPHTIDSRIRRALPKVAECLTARSRKPGRLMGLGLLWTQEQWAKVRTSLASLRDSLVSSMQWGRLGRCLAYCAPLAVLPGHAFAKDWEIDGGEPFKSPVFELSQASMFVAMNNALSSPEQSEQVILPPQPSVAPRTILPHAMDANVASPAEVPAQDVEKIEKLQEPDECQNTLGLAIAKKNTNQLAQCVDILEALRKRDPVCAQSDDWRLLNAACRNH